MIEVIVGCLFPMILTPDSLSDFQQCQVTEKHIENVIPWYSLVSDYFKEEDIPRALGIIHCESSGRPTAIGNNSNGTRDVGLWQFNDDTWAWLKPKLGIMSDRTNAQVSTAVASWLVYNDGWYHWNSSKHCWKGTSNDLLYIEKKS